MPAEKKTHRHRGRTLPDFIRPDKEKQSSRRFLGGDETTTIVVQLKTVTPILGGGYRTRELDDVDVIRVPTIRGHLRFWWRALYAQGFIDKDNGNKIDSKKLYKAERELWGGAGGEDDGAGKSKVEMSIVIGRKGNIDSKNVDYHDRAVYALWPARGTRQEDPAPRRGETEFTLTVICPKDGEQEHQVRNALKAWILFGGYGSRTRRGLGSLTVKKEDQDQWLPTAATKKAINGLFEGLDPLGKEVGEEDKFKGDTPRLPGALLYVKDTKTKAEDAWVKALNKLKEFRQGAQVGRESRMGLTRWPEADKVRKLLGRKLRCKYNGDKYAFSSNNYYWPRASFGLPLKIWFKKDDEHEIKWKWKDKKKSSESDKPTRLASPLILKPLPLTGDRFVPCALWLNRGYPKDGVVYVEGNGISNSEAPFDKLTADKDKVLFKPLQEKESLRKAFLDWLGKEGFKEVQ